jgi:hypothetical protein
MGALVTDSVTDTNEEGTFLVNAGLIFVSAAAGRPGGTAD